MSFEEMYSMKFKVLLAALLSVSLGVSAGSTVQEGVVKKAEVITTKVGADGKPLLGAAVGVGIGSMIGSGSGKDAAQIAGGIIGAKRQANKRKQQMYGWRYIVEVKDELIVVDSWCESPNYRCQGVVEGKEVYVINNQEVSEK